MLGLFGLCEVVGPCFILLMEERPDKFPSLIDTVEGARRRWRRKSGWSAGGLVFTVREEVNWI